MSDANFTDRVGYQSGVGLGLGGNAQPTNNPANPDPDFRATVFPVEASLLLKNASHDLLKLYGRAAVEGRFGTGTLGQVVDARLGINTFAIGLDVHAGVNFQGKAVVGAELNFLDTTRLMMPGICFGYEKLLGAKDGDFLMMSLRWAYPFPNWVGYYDRIGKK